MISACSRSLALALAVFAVALAACSRFQVEYKSEPGWSPAGASTYAWRAEPKDQLGDPRVDEELVVRALRAAANEDLVAKGYKIASGDEADFQVGYWLTIGSEDVSAPLGGSQEWEDDDRGPSYWELAMDVPPSNIEKGTIVLYVIDGDPPHNVWRGFARGVVNFKASRQERTKRVSEAVRRILEEFPRAAPTP